MMTAGKSGGRPVILVAEDNEDEAALFLLACEKENLGVHFRLVKDGQEAVDYLLGKPPYDDRRQHPLPKLLITDLSMPRVNGFELLQWLQHAPGFHRLPAIVLTNSDDPADKELATRLGATKYFVKPIEFARLAEIIHTICHEWLGIPAISQQQKREVAA